MLFRSNTVADVINNDPSINGKIKVVFIEGTPGTDWKLCPLPVKGTVTSAMTAKYNRKPFVDPVFHKILESHAGNADSDHSDQNVPQNSNDDTDQCSDSGSFGSFWFCVFPYKE